MQVLDEPPDVVVRRPSTFLLIPAGSAGRDLHFAASHAADHHLSGGINAAHLKTDFAMSSPIVVTACMGSSPTSWEPKQLPIHGTRAPGGVAVHSVKALAWLLDHLIGARQQ